MTTESRRMMRIPQRKEAQHFQIMGDTGVGKTQLIMQILRQIRDRKDSAIVYDPACEYIQRFFDKERGDIVLNPLDDRCPYWGPAQEMESNAEADAIAASLYQRKTDVIDEFFHDTPAQIFAHLLKLGPTPHQLAAWMASDAELLKTGRREPRWPSILTGRPGRSEQASYPLSLSSRRASGSCRRKMKTGPVWNARTWAKKRQGWIFITSRPRGAGHPASAAFALDRSAGYAPADCAAAGTAAGMVCDRRVGEFAEVAAASYGDHGKQEKQRTRSCSVSRARPSLK